LDIERFKDEEFEFAFRLWLFAYLLEIIINKEPGAVCIKVIQPWSRINVTLRLNISKIVRKT